jgi:hypothetical protein
MSLGLVLSAWAPTGLFAQNKPDKAEGRELKRAAMQDPTFQKPKKPEADAEKGGRSKPAEAEARAQARLREQLEVADDAEWQVIADRINQVVEARRRIWAGSAVSRGSPASLDIKKRSFRKETSAHPERDTLRTGLKDKLPDAEIRTRLAKAHEVHTQNEARLTRAEADLRAVLTVRQEAVAVLAGLLTP